MPVNVLLVDEDSESKVERLWEVKCLGIAIYRYYTLQI